MANDKWAKPQKMWDERFAQAVPVYDKCAEHARFNFRQLQGHAKMIADHSPGRRNRRIR